MRGAGIWKIVPTYDDVTIDQVWASTKPVKTFVTRVPGRRKIIHLVPRDYHVSCMHRGVYFMKPRSDLERIQIPTISVYKSVSDHGVYGDLFEHGYCVFDPRKALHAQHRKAEAD